MRELTCFCGPHNLPTSQLPTSTWGGGHLKDTVYWKSQLSGETSAFYWSDCVDITTNASDFSARSEFLASQGSVYSLRGGIFGNSCKQFVTIKTLVCLSMMMLTYQSSPKIWPHLISYCFSVWLKKVLSTRAYRNFLPWFGNKTGIVCLL